MTKKEFLKTIEKYPDNSIIMVNGENCPIPVTSVDEGFQSKGGKTTYLLILEAEEPEED